MNFSLSFTFHFPSTNIKDLGRRIEIYLKRYFYFSFASPHPTNIPIEPLLLIMIGCSPVEEIGDKEIGASPVTIAVSGTGCSPVIIVFIGMGCSPELADADIRTGCSPVAFTGRGSSPVVIEVTRTGCSPVIILVTGSSPVIVITTGCSPGLVEVDIIIGCSPDVVVYI